MKQSFALFITIMLVVLFATLSVSIIQTNTIATNIDTLKYYYLQGNIYLANVKTYIQTHSISEIDNLNLNDSRFNLKLVKYQDGNKTAYHIYIKTTNDTSVRVYDSVVKI